MYMGLMGVCVMWLEWWVYVRLVGACAIWLELWVYVGLVGVLLCGWSVGVGVMWLE